MSRARNIKPGFFRNEDLAECEPMARLMFVGLWTLADRNGNLENRPKRLKGELFPYDNCDPAALLAQLVAHGLVVPYEADGASLLNIPAFKAHQNPHMAEKPKYPEPSASTGPVPGQHRANPADSLLLNPDSPSLNPESLSSGAKAPELPDWLDKTAWREWEAYRRESRKPLRPTTIRQQLAFLQQQPNHAAVIRQSIRNQWEGLFALKGRDVPEGPPIGDPAKEKANLDRLAALVGGVKRVPR